MALWFSSPLVFLCCWCVAPGCVVWWVCCCLVCGWWLVGVCLVCVVLVFCLCWFWCVLVGPLFFWLVVVVVLLCPLFCSWLLLCVAPSWCWLLLVRVLLFWWFLVVVGPPPLFCHDLGWLWSCSWFNAECHPGWVAVWCFCSWRFMGVRLGVLLCSSRCLRIRRFCLVCVWFGFLLPVVFRLVLVSLVLLFLSALLLLFLGFVSCLARFFWFVLFVFLRLVVCRVLPCFGLLRCVSF